MSKIIRDIKKIKTITKELLSKEEMKAMSKKVEELQAQMDVLVEQRKLKDKEFIPEPVKKPTDSELHQVVADLLSDKSNWDDVMELLQIEGIDATIDVIIEFMNNPLKKEFNKQFNAIIRGAYKSLNKDLIY